MDNQKLKFTAETFRMYADSRVDSIAHHGSLKSLRNAAKRELKRRGVRWTGEGVAERCVMNCNICGKAPGNPYRVYDERGKVIQGCVGSAHDGALVTPSESARWHARPEAKKHRTAIRKAARS